MSTNQPGVIIGLTGGIATGKSTVSQFFRDAGVPVIDADQLAREIVAPGTPALREIAETFGDEVIAGDGTLDRNKLGDRIFQDHQARATLNAITHPRIAEAMFARAREEFERSHQWVIYDAALLVETGTHRFLDSLIVVHCSEQTQHERLRRRDNLDQAQAQQRIDAQMALDEKLQAADFVIDNDGDLEDTKQQVEQLKQRIDDLIETHGTASQPRENS